jgi:hypothetical protein
VAQRGASAAEAVARGDLDQALDDLLDAVGIVDDRRFELSSREAADNRTKK